MLLAAWSTRLSYQYIASSILGTFYQDGCGCVLGSRMSDDLSSCSEHEMVLTRGRTFWYKNVLSGINWLAQLDL